MLWLFTLMSFSFFGLTLLQENSQLLLLQTLFRHGDRSPKSLYPADPNNANDFYPEGLGKLTLLGRKQQYAVGKYLRSRYSNFITSNPNEILVNSSDVDRCLTSAEANIASFYAPEGIWKFENGLDWQPIPVHYLPYSEDKFLSSPFCQRADDKSKRLCMSDDVQSFFQDNKKSLEDISQHAGFNVSKSENLSTLYDALDSEKIHNLKIPNWVEPYWSLLKKGANLVESCSFNSPELARLRAGPLIRVITDNMERKLNGLISDLKLQVFSSHGDNLSAIILALTSLSMPIPPFASNLVFELHQFQNKTGAVRLVYFNSTTPEINVGPPHVLKVKGCSEFCPLDEFVKITKPIIPDDWDAECRQE